MTPKISVIMPVYNCVDYIGESVESILSQTFTDFELLIIDDHSTDGTYKYLQGLTDSRIRLIRKPQNTGYAKSLNIGLDMAKGEYIARMDGDDISLPERFAKQVFFMDNNPGVVVSGTAYKILGTDTIIKMPLTYEEAKVVSIMQVPVAHPTVIMRRSVLNKYHLLYNEELEPAEDYDLWTRILEIGRIENLRDVLLLYRRHTAQESITKYNRLIEAAISIRYSQLTKLITFNDKPYDNLFAISILTKQDMPVSAALINKIVLLLTDMYKSNSNEHIYEKKLLYNYLREAWLFYILKFNKPALYDVALLFNTRKMKLTRMGLVFNLQFLKKILVSFIFAGPAYKKTSLQKITNESSTKAGI